MTVTIKSRRQASRNMLIEGYKAKVNHAEKYHHKIMTIILKMYRKEFESEACGNIFCSPIGPQ